MRWERLSAERPDSPTDRDVVRLIVDGDREAFRLLVRRYQDVLFRHALRMTNESDVAADLVQAAFIKAYTNIARCRDPERFGAWLFRILTNGCKDHLKNRRRRDVSLEETMVTAVTATTPQTDLERNEARALLEGALETLPDSLREAFILKHIEGRSYEEIADLLDTSVPALKMRVHRAREALRDALEKVR